MRLLVLLLFLFAQPAAAADRLVLQLQGGIDARFAGYYSALLNGIYAEAGLDVEVRQSATDGEALQALAAGEADVAVDWMQAALGARERGLPVVHIAQPFQRGGLSLACRRELDYKFMPDGMLGDRVGIEKRHQYAPIVAWVLQDGYDADDAPVSVMPADGEYDAATVLRGAECTVITIYEQYWHLIYGGFDHLDLYIYPFQHYNVATLEDGLYASEASLADPLMRERLARFVDASRRGWQWVRDNQHAALGMMMGLFPEGATNALHQRRVLREVLYLEEPRSWELQEVDYRRTVDVLLADPGRSVITREPEGAWTHAVSDLVVMEDDPYPIPK